MPLQNTLFENVMYNLLNNRDKSKYNIKTWNNLQDINLRRELWPDESENHRLSAFIISKNKKEVFLRTLENVSVLDSYSSNVLRCIDLNHEKIFGLESHNYYIIMQQFLSIAIHKMLPNKVVYSLSWVFFFLQIWSKAAN